MKLVILHDSVKKETELLNSFNDDCLIRWASEYETIENLINNIDLNEITQIAFVYHNPNCSRLPFFYDHFDNDKSQKEKYFYFSDNIINLFKKFNTGFIIDILTCDLNRIHFRNEVTKIEQDLQVNIRYSLNQTGNNPDGDWILESDNVNVKNIYFTTKINKWTGTLEYNPILLSQLNPSYFNVSFDELTGKTTYTLLQDVSWSDLILRGVDGLIDTNRDLNDYIKLGQNDIFDGNNFVIDLTGINNFDGIFGTSGDSISSSIIKNVGTINGSLDLYGGFIIKSEQSYFEVENCYSNGIVNDCGGGICGSWAGSGGNCKVTNSYFTGCMNDFGGGICGYGAGMFGSCIIENCYSTCNIGIYGGGICGKSAGEEGECIIRNCYSTGNSKNYGDAICGIYAGYNGSCILDNCYSTA